MEREVAGAEVLDNLVRSISGARKIYVIGIAESQLLAESTGEQDEDAASFMHAVPRLFERLNGMALVKHGDDPLPELRNMVVRTPRGVIVAVLSPPIALVFGGAPEANVALMTHVVTEMAPLMEELKRWLRWDE